jgi:IPT/TIG domain
MSQRHKIENYNTASNGEVHAQGVVAESVAAQVDPESYNVLLRAPGKATEVPEGGFVVPEGPPGGPLQGSSMSGAIPDSVQPTPPEPDEGQPVLDSIDPSSANIGDPDLTMNVNGSKFVDGSVIVFNGGDEETTFISDSQLSTIIKPSTATTPGSYGVNVRNPDGQYAPLEQTFTFIEAVAPEGARGGRALPIGPFTISLIEDHEDGIRLDLAEGDVRVGDTVLIEATGNTSVNGDYTVLALLKVLGQSGLSIVVDNDLVLLNSIEAKGRLTVTGEA